MMFWKERSPIVANLLNPAFCGEIIRVAVNAFNKKANKSFPVLLVYLILPIILHKETRNKMPRSTRTYLFVWIEENENVLYDFSKRAKSMVRYTKEALLFLKVQGKIEIDEHGNLFANEERRRANVHEDYQEYNDIMKKAEMLGKWFSSHNNTKSIYSFFRITP